MSKEILAKQLVDLLGAYRVGYPHNENEIDAQIAEREMLLTRYDLHERQKYSILKVLIEACKNGFHQSSILHLLSISDKKKFLRFFKKESRYRHEKSAPYVEDKTQIERVSNLFDEMDKHRDFLKELTEDDQENFLEPLFVFARRTYSNGIILSDGENRPGYRRGAREILRNKLTFEDVDPLCFSRLLSLPKRWSEIEQEEFPDEQPSLDISCLSVPEQPLSSNQTKDQFEGKSLPDENPLIRLFLSTPLSNQPPRLSTDHIQGCESSTTYAFALRNDIENLKLYKTILREVRPSFSSEKAIQDLMNDLKGLREQFDQRFRSSEELDLLGRYEIQNRYTNIMRNPYRYPLHLKELQAQAWFIQNTFAYRTSNTHHINKERMDQARQYIIKKYIPPTPQKTSARKKISFRKEGKLRMDTTEALHRPENREGRLVEVKITRLEESIDIARFQSSEVKIDDGNIRSQHNRTSDSRQNTTLLRNTGTHYHWFKAKMSTYKKPSKQKKVQKTRR